MKLLHVITSLETGGAQRLLSDLLPIQRKQGIDVSLLVYEYLNNNFTKQIIDGGISIINLNKKNFKNPLLIYHIRKIIKDFDLIHVHLFPSLYWVAIASINLKKIKLIYTEHSTSNKRREKWYLRSIERLMYKKYDKIIAISDSTKNQLKKWLGFSDNNLFVTIHNGINTKMFTKTNKEVNPKYIIMISRFVPAKDQETVIRAIPYINSTTIVRFVGDGNTLGYCKQIANDIGVSNRVEFLGERLDIPDLIAEAYIGIQSSHWEGFGLTAIEIMSAGKPIIASNVDGLKQVVEGAGEIFEQGNAQQLAYIINKLLIDSDYYITISKQCQKRAQEYDIKNMAEKYKEQYDNLYKSLSSN